MEIQGPLSGSVVKGSDGRIDHATWSVNLEAGCTALVSTVIENNQLRIDWIRFTCPDGRDLTTPIVRSLSLGAFKLQVIERIQANPNILGKSDQVISELLGQPVDRAEIRKAARLLHKGPSKGRAARSPEFHRDTALMYLKFLPEHGQRVIAAMAEELRRSPNTVSTWVRRAREEDWLSKGTQGKAGGRPGPKLVEWMKEQKQS